MLLRWPRYVPCRCYASKSNGATLPLPRQRKFDQVSMSMQAKLHRLDQKYGLFTPQVKSVVDLGYAPGNWSLFAKNRMCQVHNLASADFNKRCHLLGVDMLFSAPPVPGMSCIQGNVFSELIQSQVALHFAQLNRPVDLILSDMATPFMQMTGFHSNTHTRPYLRFNANPALNKPIIDPDNAAVNLGDAALHLATRVVGQGGLLVVRMSRLREPRPSRDEDEFVERLEAYFGKVAGVADNQDHIYVCQDKLAPPEGVETQPNEAPEAPIISKL